jgi:regulator of sirC expression with transglutaminase-like and TPR domain
MRGLTRRESVALMATTVLEYLDRENRHAEALELAEAILALDPKNIHALLSRGNAAARLVELAPPHQRDDAQRWLAVNRASFERAERLGWEPAHESESREKKE